MVVLRAGKRRH